MGRKVFEVVKEFEGFVVVRWGMCGIPMQSFKWFLIGSSSLDDNVEGVKG